MPPTFFQRLAIIVLGSTALMADTLWMLNTELIPPRARGPRCPTRSLRSALWILAKGRWSAPKAILPRAGYSWAVEKRPIAEVNCPNDVPAFQRGCVQWLADIRDADPDWASDPASHEVGAQI